MSIFKSEPSLTAADVRRIAREAARAEVETRLNMIEVTPVPNTPPGLLSIAVDAFDAVSFVINAGAALAIGLARTVVVK